MCILLLVENKQKTKTKKLIIVGFILKKKKGNDQYVKETPSKELKQECYGMKEEPEEIDSQRGSQ